MSGLFDLQIAALAGLETWKPIVGYEGFYEVSSLGRVKHVAMTIVRRNRWGGLTEHKWPERILLLTVDRGKYARGRLQVKLSRDGEAKTRLVHQLVASAFIGPCPEGHEVAHNDGNAANNALKNLRYATPAQNTGDKTAHGTVLRGEGVGNSKLSTGDVLEIRRLRGSAGVATIAQRFGISQAQVSRIQTGKRWGHIGGGANG